VDGAEGGEVSGGVHFSQAGDGGDVAGRGVWEEREEAGSALFDECFCGDVLVEEALELLGERGGDVGWEQDGVGGPGAQGVEQGGPGAAGVLAIEVEDLLVGHSDEVVGVRAVSEEHADTVALEGAGLDDGSRSGQAGVSLAELLEVDDGVGPEAVELLAELAFQVAEEAGLGADEADLLADEEFGAGGEEGRLTEAAEHQVKHGRQVARVGLALAEVGLLAGKFDLVGVEEAVLKGGLGAVEKGCVVVHQGAGPGFMVDAGRLVAEEDKAWGAVGDQAVGPLDELGEAGGGRRETMGAYQFQAGGGPGSGPVGILADVQEDDEGAVQTHAGQPLAEGSDAVGVVAFQVA